MFNASSCQPKKKEKKYRETSVKKAMVVTLWQYTHCYSCISLCSRSHSVSVRECVCIIPTTNSQYIMPYINECEKNAYRISCIDILTAWQELVFPLHLYATRPNLFGSLVGFCVCSFRLESFKGETIAGYCSYVLFRSFID